MSSSTLSSIFFQFCGIPCKRSSVNFWDYIEYTTEVKKQLNDTKAYMGVAFNKKILQELVGTSNK